MSNADDLDRSLDLSVIVPTRNRAAILPDCLTALIGQDAAGHDFEVVVVDNASADETSSVAAELARSNRRVRVVSAPIPGLNRARNVGIRAALGRVIAFIDDDELVPDGWVTRVCDAFEDRPELDGVGGPYRESEGTTIRTCDACSLGALEPPHADDGSAPRLLGGNMAIRRGTFEGVGDFDESLSGRGDETEWFARAREHGCSFEFHHDLWIWHRRDVFTLRDLLVTQFRQGIAWPRAMDALQKPSRPRPLEAGRALAHAFRRGCAMGLLRAAREAGACWGWLRLRRSPGV